MSRGLGKVERQILDALQALKRPYVALWELVLLVDGPEVAGAAWAGTVDTRTPRTPARTSATRRATAGRRRGERREVVAHEARRLSRGVAMDAAALRFFHGRLPG